MPILPVNDFERAVDIAKQAVRSAIQRKEKWDGTGAYAPSSIWEKCLHAVSYLDRLSAQDLINIRFHCDFINGDNKFEYWVQDPPIDPEWEMKRLRFDEAIQGVPRRYWASEPEWPHFPFPFSITWQGVRLNYNTVRMQRCISDLYSLGFLEEWEQSSSRSLLVEIGGGYGALAGHLATMLRDRITYVVFDFPEIFYFQFPYLLASYPDLQIFIWCENDGLDFFRKCEHSRYDVILIPNYMFEIALSNMSVDLAINMQSFMEMTDTQLDLYLRTLSKCLRGPLYSDNTDSTPYNRLDTPITSHLLKYYELQPYPEYYDTCFNRQKLRWSMKYRRYICQPRESINNRSWKLDLSFPPDDNQRGGRLKILYN